jgi:NADH:ubiquinone oxidoreductase subunit 2 (subunit N)
LFLTFILLEGIAFQSYVLAGYNFTKISIDTALKYFLLGGISSGILLYGISLLFGAYNTLHYDKIAFLSFKQWYVDPSLGSIPLVTKVSVFFILFGLLFKLGAYPLHV